MSRRQHVWIARAGFVVLVALHLDLWRPARTGRVGWMPEELAWRLAWMGLAFLYLAHFCAFVWREDEE